MSVDTLVKGLKLAGPNPTQASLISSLLGVTDYNGDGLYGTHTLSYAMSDRGKITGADNCFWVVKYSGTTFQLVKGMQPICGQTVAGASISSP